MWSVARQDFKLSEQEFRRLNLKKFYLLLARVRFRQQQQDLRFWHLIDCLYNSNIKEKENRLKPEQVFPSLEGLFTEGGDNAPAVSDDEVPSFDEARASFNLLVQALGSHR